MREREHVLQLENITMQFGGVVAVNNLSLEVNKGEIVALIGPNGAGKTTAFNVITGVYQPTMARHCSMIKVYLRNHPQGKMKKGYKGRKMDCYIPASTSWEAPKDKRRGEAAGSLRVFKPCSGPNARPYHENGHCPYVPEYPSVEEYDCL